MFNESKVNKNFISNIDQRLAEFDKTHPKSASQLAEIRKYRRIYELRDNPDAENHEPSDLWQN